MLVRRTIILGGARSGKSGFAEDLVAGCPPPWTYLATAQPLDGEMQARISEHRHRRGPGWQSVEAPLDVTAVLADLPATGTLLLDCATLWLTNHMLAGHDLDARTADLVAAIRDCRGRVVVVSNELGMGLVPETRLGRVFRDAQGRLNQALAAQADLAVLVVAGLPVVLKGALPDGPP